MKPDSPDIEWPDRRVVLLGASNLALGLPTVLRTARQRWGAPLDFMAALGHGRSYGRTHRVLGRTLSGITECGIWTALEERPPAPTAALVTDIGNDILFDATIDEIERWLEQCLVRLNKFAEQVVVTELPLQSIFSLSRTRFFLARQILFPKSRLRFEEAIDKATELNERTKKLAVDHGARLFAPRAQWYGFDPIHVRRRDRARAWNAILSLWNNEDLCEAERFTLVFKAQLRMARPQQRWLFGLQQQKEQPVIRLRDRTCVSLY